jgi:hypothetical protein
MATAAITSLARFCQGVTTLIVPTFLHRRLRSNTRTTEGTDGSEINLRLPYEAAVFQFWGSEVQEQAEDAIALLRSNPNACHDRAGIVANSDLRSGDVAIPAMMKRSRDCVF